MKKKIILDDGNVIVINITEGYCGPVVSVSKGFINNDLVTKTINFCIWDDISFLAYTEDNKVDFVEFEFDIDDPLYFCINRLLGKNERLIIDDDLTADKLKKYVLIENCHEIFKITFINKLEYTQYCFDKFRAFIKNIGPDCRSKITDFSIKLRLVDFFRDIENTLLEEFHQISIEEYIQKNKYEKKKKKSLKIY